MFRAATVALILSALAGRAAAQADLSDAQLRAVFRQAVLDVTAFTGLEPAEGLAIRLLAGDTFARALGRQVHRVYREEGLGSTASGLVAQGIAVSDVVGQYAHAERTILVDVDRLRAELRDFEEFAPEWLEPWLRGLALHEAAHAVSIEAYGLDAGIVDVVSTPVKLAQAALVEGYANWVAREILAAEGDEFIANAELDAFYSEGLVDSTDFGRFTPGHVLEGNVPLYPYLNGERFVRHVARVRGAKGVTRLFTELPESLEQINDPDLYLGRRADDEGLALVVSMLLGRDEPLEPVCFPLILHDMALGRFRPLLPASWLVSSERTLLLRTPEALFYESDPAVSLTRYDSPEMARSALRALLEAGGELTLERGPREALVRRVAQRAGTCADGRWLIERWERQSRPAITVIVDETDETDEVDEVDEVGEVGEDEPFEPYVLVRGVAGRTVVELVATDRSGLDDATVCGLLEAVAEYEGG